MDYRKYYHLERYLLGTVRLRFKSQGYLEAFDFFCIIIWKAQRAKSKIAEKLRDSYANLSLDEAVKNLTRKLAQQPNARDRLQILWDSKFGLPMASAILTVLYPEEFTVYDKRVCDVLRDFHGLNHLTNFNRIWVRYQEFRRKVEKTAPSVLSLRDKDRYLWGKSFHKQLVNDIKRQFK